MRLPLLVSFAALLACAPATPPSPAASAVPAVAVAPSLTPSAVPAVAVAVAPSPTPTPVPVADRTYTCGYGPETTVIPLDARDADGLPLRGSLAIGVPPGRLPMLRGKVGKPVGLQYSLMRGPTGNEGGQTLAYDLGGVTAVLAINTPHDDAAVPVVFSGLVVAAGGLTTVQADAWLAALVACEAAPSVGTADAYLHRTEAPMGVLNTKGFYADFLTLQATRTDVSKLGSYMSPRGDDARTFQLPDPGPVPADRWAGVAAYGMVLD